MLYDWVLSASLIDGTGLWICVTFFPRRKTNHLFHYFVTFRLCGTSYLFMHLFHFHHVLMVWHNYVGNINRRATHENIHYFDPSTALLITLSPVAAFTITCTCVRLLVSTWWDFRSWAIWWPRVACMIHWTPYSVNSSISLFVQLSFAKLLPLLSQPLR